ncbi:MAG: amidohydrolase [Planctomycetota bacterium]
MKSFARQRLFCPLLTIVSLLFGAGSSPAAPPADIILRGGSIVTVDPSQPQAEAIAIRRNRILAVGDWSEIQTLQNEQTELIQLKPSQSVLPGLIESHAHLVQLGEKLMTLDLSTQSSWDGVIAAVVAAAQDTPKGIWIVGSGWHQSKWVEMPRDAVDGYPSHQRLSKLTPDHPVTLAHASYHGTFANELAMKLAEIDSETPDPPGGTILRDEQGNATGAMLETAAGLIARAKARSESGVPADVRRRRFALAVDLATKECLKHGVTTFYDAGLTVRELDGLIALAEESGLGVRVHAMIRDSNDQLKGNLKRLRRVDTADGFLSIRGIKKMADGALGSHGAWLLAPYEDRPASRGLAIATADEILEAADLAIEHDYQLCVHAIGDRANRETLNHFEKASKKAEVPLRDLRWRIEHAQHIHPQDIPRFGRLGVIASMQGVHCTSDSIFVPTRLGYRRSAEGAFVWRSLMESNATICNGTDAPVEKIDPFACLYSTITRRSEGRDAFFPEQCMNASEALRSYTFDAAYAMFTEDSRGSLEAGKLADLVVIDHDWATIPSDDVAKTKVVMTMVDGKIVYQTDANK